MEYEQYFHYPIDTAKLLSKKARIKRALKENLYNPIQKKIAILGGSTTNEVTDQLELFLLQQGIEPVFYQSGYNQYWQDAMFGTEELNLFSPDVIYIHTNWRNILQFPEMSDSAEQVNEKLEQVFQHFRSAWEALRNRFSCPIIQNNFERPNHRLLGNRDIWDCHGKSNFISRLNQKIYQYATENKDFYINDIDALAAIFGLPAWNDSFCWHMYKYGMNLNAVPLVAQSVSNIIKSLFGKNKKALVLDLDNTLWGGVIGDDGQEGIAIGPEVPEGQVYSEFQTYCKSLKSLGVILAVNSKNEVENALLGLNHPSGILCPDDFVSIKANWKPKSENIIEIASDLNLGPDSFVFVDDNPAEREIVFTQISGIAVPFLDSPESYIKIIDGEGYFETTVLSTEDLKKTEMYKANELRAQEMKTYASYEEYLRDLQMVADIHSFDDLSIARVAQLTNKSNQFNLTTLRCTEDDIREMKNNDQFITLQGSLSDKFGDNGIVSVVAGEVCGEALHIRLWLMSCRVLKRGMEDAMMEQLLARAKEKGIHKLVGYYYPTAKNSMVREFYKPFGFLPQSLSSCEAGEIWVLETEKYISRVHYIDICKENKND